MTGRGKAGTPASPLLPPRDPTLAVRPVPQERRFHVRPVGPGAAPDIQDTVEWLDELEARLGPFSRHDRGDDPFWLLRRIEDERNMLHPDGSTLDDPTWGYYVFTTSYSEAAMGNLEPAVLKMLEIIRQPLRESNPDLVAEMMKRFKLDLIQDREVLEGASDDRIREEFNALLRGQGLWTAEIHDTGPMSPACDVVCLVLDEAKIMELATLTLTDKVDDGDEAWEKAAVKIIDRLWERPGDGRGSYPGVDECPIRAFGTLYCEVGDGCDDSTMDLYPMCERI